MILVFEYYVLKSQTCFGNAPSIFPELRLNMYMVWYLFNIRTVCNVLSLLKSFNLQFLEQD